ncbi:MAG: hypothetical protein LQ352_007326 [Teloschistes flavicans]|nr:MAG: hypothetical protein LQ352_007326 [Teloschistes flavicans]
MLDEEESEDSDVYVPSDGDEEAMPSTDRGLHSKRHVSSRRERSVSSSGGAGGFARENVIDDDDDVGGGFIPDDGNSRSQAGDDGVGGGFFVPDANNHAQYAAEDVDGGGGFIIEDHATTSTSPQSQVSYEASEEKPLELSKTSTAPSQREEEKKDDHFQSPTVLPLNDQTFDTIHEKKSAAGGGFSTGKTPETPAFRAEEEKHRGDDHLGLSDAEIAEAAVLEKEYYERKEARGAGPSIEEKSAREEVYCDDDDERKAQGADPSVVERSTRENAVLEKMDDERKEARGADPSGEDTAREELKEMMNERSGFGVDVGGPELIHGSAETRDEERSGEEVQVEAEAEAEADEEDKGSLLSEDPSDEDAEPEWLA